MLPRVAAIFVAYFLRYRNFWIHNLVSCPQIHTHMLCRAERSVAVSICYEFLNVREEVAAEYRALENLQHDDRSNALDETLHCASWTTTAHAAGSKCSRWPCREGGAFP